MLHMQTMRFNGIREDENGQWLDVTPTSAPQPVPSPPVPVRNTPLALMAEKLGISHADFLKSLEDARKEARAAKVAARNNAMDSQ